MYHPIKVEPLSKAQVSKLLKGQKVRVKKGSHHTLHVSEEQHKKLTKAHMKGAGITLQLDPYACDMNEHMIGEGIMSKLKGAASKALSIGKKAIQKAIDTNNTVFVDFRIEPEENVYPMVPAGSAINKMIDGLA